jgi:hypothetical protein
MLPDAATTIRQRTGAVSVALGEDHGLLPAVIGELVLAGATNLQLDRGHGDSYTWEPLFPSAGQWVVEMADNGEVRMRYLAEGKE